MAEFVNESISTAFDKERMTNVKHRMWSINETWAAFGHDLSNALSDGVVDPGLEQQAISNSWDHLGNEIKVRYLHSHICNFSGIYICNFSGAYICNFLA